MGINTVDKWTVYGLKDPTDHKFRYVGCTNFLDSRLAQHILQYGSFNNKLSAWIATCIVPEVETLAVCETKIAVLRAERHWIAKLRNEGHPLVNRNYRDFVARAKMAAAKLGIKHGRKLSEEQKACMQAAKARSLAERGGRRSWLDSKTK